MKILVLGGTGRTGRLVVRSALAAGHDVSVLVREPSRLDSTDGLRVVTGDATDAAHIRRALDGQHAVISALGSPSMMRSNVVTPAAAALVSGAEAGVARRVVFMSAFGVGSTSGQSGVLVRAAFATLLRSFYRDKTNAERIIIRSSLDWTIVQPVTLTDGAGAGQVVAGEVREPRGSATITRTDVAEFLVAAVGSSEWSRRSVVLSGAVTSA